MSVAPRHMRTPFQRGGPSPTMRRAHGRVDPIGTEDDRCVGQRAGLDGDAEVQAVIAEAIANRPLEDPVEVATVDRQLRDGVAGGQSTRFAPHVLAAPRGQDQVVGADPVPIELVEQAEVGPAPGWPAAAG